MISKDNIDKVLERANILDVVQDFISLKKRGVNYLGLCPFHNEKTPSFNVSPAKGIYKCFGCGEAGNSLQFVMKVEHLSYPEAIKFLGKKFGVDVEDKVLSQEEQIADKERESLMVIVDFARKYFSDNLTHFSEGKSLGMAYWRHRGFTDETISKFQLGYSLVDRDAFTQHALKHGFKLDLLVKTGLSIVGEGYQLDRFAGRVMFPIHSLSGRVIGFGGRTLKTDKNIAKYLNSPESDIYHKSNVLFGISFARAAIVKADRCILVEGYTDMISMFQAGVENVVASSGTSLTVNQIRLIKRFTANVTIIYDSDSAGIKASLRGIDLLIEEGLNVRIVLMPEGEDPDSFARNQGAAAFREYIESKEENFVSFKAKLLKNEADKDPVSRAQNVAEMAHSIAREQSNIERELLIRECAHQMDIDEKELRAAVNIILNRKKESREAEQQNTTIALPEYLSYFYSEIEEKNIIWSLLNFGNEIYNSYIDEDNLENNVSVGMYIIHEILSESLEFNNLIYKQFFQDYAHELAAQGHVSMETFTNHVDEKLRTLAATMLSTPYTLSKVWLREGIFTDTPENTYKKDIPKLLNTFKLKIVLQGIETTDTQLKNMPPDASPEAWQEIMQTKMVLNELKKELVKLAGERTVFL